MNKRTLSLTLALMMMTSQVTYADELNSPLDYMRLLVDLVRENYIHATLEADLYEGAYKGIFDALDKHSKYYSKEEYNAFVDANSGNYSGVGIILNNEFKIIAVSKDSPAERAGIHVNDHILSVDKLSTSDMTLDEVNGSINGDEDTKVVLSIKREGYLNPLIFEMKREKGIIQSVQYRMEGAYGLIRLISFNDNTYGQVLEALAFFDQRHYEGLIIDVRDNPGGSLESVVAVADLFLPVGKDIVHMKYKNQAGRTFFSEAMPLDVECIILINGQSASASEIFASAMKGHDVAELVGEKTFGKGTVQSLYQLTNGSGLKLTVGEFKGAGMTVIDGVGVTPDYPVENLNAENPLLDHLVPMSERVQKTYGDISLNVYGAQQRLKILGYDLDVDGIYGPQTEAAIYKYKWKKSLLVSRVIDSKLIVSLNKDIEDLINGTGEDFQLEKAIAVLKESPQ